MDGLRLETASILFADVKGFSTLTDFQLRQFFLQALPRVATVLEENEPWAVNSWGDGVVAFFRDAASAARCGLTLRDMFSRGDWRDYGLPDELALRVGLHFAPVYIGHDPIRKVEGVVGTQINLAARIEPVVPINRVFATLTFVEVLKTHGTVKTYAWDGVGPWELAKGWGVEELYNVRWGDEAPFMSHHPTPVVESVRVTRLEEIDPLLGSVAARLDNAIDGIYISGNDCAHLVSRSQYIVNALERDVVVHVMAVHPNERGAETLPLIDPRFANLKQFRASIRAADQLFRDLRVDYPNNFDYRYLSFAPPVGFFITDPARANGVCKVELYVAKPFDPGGSRPHWIVDRSSSWREFWLTQWSNFWALATRPSAPVCDA